MMQPSHMFNKRDTGSDEQCRQCHVVGYITSYNGHKYSLGTRVRLQHKADSRNCLLSGFLSLKGLLLLLIPLDWCERTQAALPRRAVGWETHQLLELPAWADKADRSSKKSSVGMSPWMINILPKERTNKNLFNVKMAIECAYFQRFISLFSILAQSHYGKIMFYGFLKGIWWITSSIGKETIH